MEQVLVDNQDYADELKELLYSGDKFSVSGSDIITKEFQFSFSPQFSGLFNQLSQFDNALIYGKNTMLGIVAIEFAEDGKLEIFYQNGTVRKFNYRHWILSDQKLDHKCEKLTGFLTYKYIRYFDSEQDKS